MNEAMQNMPIENEAAPKHKERHMVTWTQNEDDILRQQISINGTDNWAIIASKFTDKTTRQCRRRWYTYLNSDFKKGGWSPEEDMLLCEAQKIYGNRWTEIAKMVSGRTDNAVKNRFSTLCKKRAKYEASTKENDTSHINLNNKRVLLENEPSADINSENEVPYKRRAHITGITENCNGQEKLHGECKNLTKQQLRPPLAVLVQNFNNVGNLPTENQIAVSHDAQINKDEGVFLKKNDPKVIALLQQAELLSSLAIKVNIENTDQSLENSWKILQDFLNQSKENDMVRCNSPDMHFQFEIFKDLIEDLRSSNEETCPSLRQPNLHESPECSEFNTGPTILSQTVLEQTIHTQAEISLVHQDIGVEIPSIQSIQQNRDSESRNVIFISPTANQGVLSAPLPMEFGSPLQVIPVFRSLEAGIPSPEFSESERNFLMKTLGAESPSLYLSADPSQPAPCRRALLPSL